MSNTAFHTKKGFNKWLKDTGIKVGETVKHLHNTKELEGIYEEISLGGNKEKLDEFCDKNNLRSSKVLSNADFTKSCIQKGKKGNKLFYLNPNYPRKIYKYKHE